jgi:hypothetical protein
MRSFVSLFPVELILHPTKKLRAIKTNENDQFRTIISKSFYVGVRQLNQQTNQPKSLSLCASHACRRTYLHFHSRFESYLKGLGWKELAVFGRTEVVEGQS